MFSDTLLASAAPAPVRAAPAVASRALYDALLDGDGGHDGAAADYLSRQLDIVAALPCDLPPEPGQLPQWAAERTADVARRYKAYLAGRRNGAPRQYFSNTAHALYFIRSVAPSKLVDGAWLYGCLRHWQENDFHPLLKTYLEELGEGLPAKNHVVLYQRLLDHYAIAGHEGLGDGHFTQGAIQLGLGYAGQAFQAEMVGYNLGYEQLPLHLLITAHELNELGIDPYYFTLHVTVDNGSTGHAHDAIAALTRLLARAANPRDYYRRVREGYKLGELGECTASVIAAFDLEPELVRILAAKAATGRDMHGDYCKVAGRTINSWLGAPSQIAQLLREFERTGWIRRGAPPAESRFWGLVQGERAEMFGVFSAYEQQVLADWIAAPAKTGAAGAAPSRVMTHRARRRAMEGIGAAGKAPGAPRPFIRHADLGDAGRGPGHDRLRALEREVASAPDKAGAMRVLLAHMSPARHHTAAGLMATRMFSRLIA